MEGKSIKVTFKTLTPLWTGDAWGESNELKLTGIIGSLRWWFEALVRGMGYKACDSTSDNKCKAEIKSPEDVLNIHNKICPVCYLFGTTGWKGRFQVSVVKNESDLSKPYNGRIVVNINGGKSWYYDSGLMGKEVLNFQYHENTIIGDLKESNGSEKIIAMKDIFPSVLKILLYLISEYGMLGAKTSMGYGVVKFKIEDADITINDKDDWENFKKYLELFGEFKGNINRLPNLKDFFFVKFNVENSIDSVINNVKKFFSYQDGIIESDVIDKWKDKNWCITSPVVRKCLRCIFRGQHSKGICMDNRSCSRNYWWNYYDTDNTRNRPNTKYEASLTVDKLSLNEKKTQNIRHFLMGSTSEPEFSAIQVSHVYRNNDDLEFRIYGWLSDFGPIKDKINDILELLQEIFQDPPWKDNALLPSKIQPGISWDSSNNKLSLVNNKIKSLFNISGGSDL